MSGGGFGEVPPGRASRQEQYERDGGLREDGLVVEQGKRADAPAVEKVHTLTPNDPLQKKSKGVQRQAEVDPGHVTG